MEKRSTRGAFRGASRGTTTRPSYFPSSSYSGRWRPSPSMSSPSPSPSDGPWKSRRGQNEISDHKVTERDDRDDSQDAPPSLVGTCPHMCPANERAQRERLRDLSVFERFNGNSGRTSPSLAVKKFCRTISTTHSQSSDIRPLPVLQETLSYLLKLLDSSEHPFEVVFEFVFDRTRSIRQDLSMQKIVNDQAVHMYEEMVKFHVISLQKLQKCSGKSDSSSFLHLNSEQLLKSLLSLYDLYAFKRRPNSINKNEAEFYSFYVLLHLGCNSQKMGDSISLWFRQLEFSILQSKEMRVARSFLRSFQMGNYRHFFKTIEAEASYLQLCLLEPRVNEVRAQALSYINYSGYKLHPYPLAHLAELLLMKESDLESLCNACGLEIRTDEANIKFLAPKQTSFCLPKGGFQSFSFLGSEKLHRWQARCWDDRTYRIADFST